MSVRSEHRPSVEYNRLLRAMALIRAGQADDQPTLERHGPQQFRVKGNDEPFYDVDLTQQQRCWCKDAYFAPSYARMCKHEIASRLANMEPGMLAYMVDVIEREMQRKREAE